jgi:hypothetical protein
MFRRIAILIIASACLVGCSMSVAGLKRRFPPPATGLYTPPISPA